MKNYKGIFGRAIGLFLVFTLICGGLYTVAVTGLAQVLFPHQANGSIIKVNGVAYGSELLGQRFSDEGHLWGRIMNIDVSTFTDSEGRRLMYAAPSNLSPASEEYGKLITQRVEKLRAANPQMRETDIPVDLVTCSGSGLDPHISPIAAEYQVARIAKARGISEAQVRTVIEQCTSGRLLSIFGEETVNVLKVNLMLDGILS